MEGCPLIHVPARRAGGDFMGWFLSLNMKRMAAMAKKCLLLLIVFCLSAAAARAEGPEDTSGKIRWIQDRLDQAASPARRWQYGWTTAYGAMTYLYAAQASTLDEDDEENDRYDAVVNACSSFLGFAGMLLDPLSTGEAAGQLKKLPESTDEEKRVKLDMAEKLLRRSAARERRGRSLSAHVLAGIVSLAAGVAVACDDDRTDDGIAMFAGSMLVSEIQIFTEPAHASRALEEYRKGGGLKVSENPSSFPLAFSVLPGGLAVHYRF